MDDQPKDKYEFNCPWCGALQRRSSWSVAHLPDDQVFTCSECELKTLIRGSEFSGSEWAKDLVSKHREDSPRRRYKKPERPKRVIRDPLFERAYLRGSNIK